MNIQVQLCGLIIILVLMLFYIRRAKLKLYTQLMFKNMFFSLFCCLGFDILSIIAIHKRDSLPMLLVVAICKIYLSTLVTTALTGFLYVYVDVFEKQSIIRKGILFYTSLAIIDIAVMFFTPIYVCQNGNIAYTDGPCIFVTYVGAAGFVFYNLFFIVKNKNALNPRRRNSMIIWISVWIAATILQFFNRQLLIIGFAGAIGTMIVFLRMENPEFFTDRATGFFNTSALTEYLNKLYLRENDFAVITVLLRYNFHKSITMKVEENLMLYLARQLSSLPYSQAFKTGDNVIQIIYENSENASDGTENIQNIFHSVLQKYKGNISAEYIYVPSSSLIKTSTELAQLIQYIDNKGLAQGYGHFLEVTDELVGKMRHEFQVVELINEAITNDRIEVFYQPIFSTDKQCFTSAEALARMRDRDGNLISPGDFIPIAEANGMILQIGEIVFDKVCRFLTEQHSLLHSLEYIEVNLSIVQCAQTNLADTYISIMQKYKINPMSINLEITESASMEAKQILLENMKSLINYGVKFSLDDFGTGQSNLNYIMEMPVNIVKFDKTLTDAYFNNEKARYIMNAAIQMIHGMGLEIVSEGIETKMQYEKLTQKGINHIQGYYFSKPLPEKEFLYFLSKG